MNKWKSFHPEKYLLTIKILFNRTMCNDVKEKEICHKKLQYDDVNAKIIALREDSLRYFGHFLFLWQHNWFVNKIHSTGCKRVTKCALCDWCWGRLEALIGRKRILTVCIKLANDGLNDSCLWSHMTSSNWHFYMSKWNFLFFLAKFLYFKNSSTTLLNSLKRW